MLSKPGIFFLVAVVALVTGPSCEKRMFHTINIKGQVLHVFTREPMAGLSVDLASDNKFSGSSETVPIARGKTDSNGFFSINGSASKAPSYYLHVNGKTIRFSMNKHDKVHDVGTILSGSKTFFCKVKLESDSGRCLVLYNPVMQRTNGKPDTVVLASIELSSDTGTVVFPITYETSVCNSGSYQKRSYSFTVPVHSDTLNYTIHY